VAWMASAGLRPVRAWVRIPDGLADDPDRPHMIITNLARIKIDANRDIVRTVIDLFGAKRCMFASNFPVDSLCGSFATILGGFRDIVADLAPHEQKALFRDNAIAIYDIL